MTPESASAALQNLVRKLGYLIEITRIVDRNAEDGTFHSNLDGEIIYVFDTNVVQMFLQPDRVPSFSEVFHTEVLRTHPSQRDHDREINQQGCLLAAEYLMSGELPGQHEDGRWYMSRLHHRETQAQIEYLQERIRENGARIDTDLILRKRTSEDLELLNAALKVDLGDRDGIMGLARQLDMSMAALDELRQMPPDKFRERAAGIQSRAACRILAREQVFQPLRQLRRFHTPQIAGAVRSLESLLNVNADDMITINREAESWRATLSTALLRRSRSASRTRDSVTADCQTLALISWASRQPRNQHRRFVFVTGDRVLLDAYRHHHVTDSQRRPFLLRPINHFAPMFNPRSAKSFLPKRDLAFRRLRQALEGAMVALNLALLSGDKSEYRLRARDHFSVQVELEIEQISEILQRYFPMFRDENWVSQQSAGFSVLIDELRAIEPLFLEAYPAFIAARLDRTRDSFNSAHDADVGEALGDKVARGLTEAVKAGFQFSLPMMQYAIEDQLEELRSRERIDGERAVIATRLSFVTDGDELLNFNQEIDKLRHAQADELPRILQPLSSRIFTIAALLAFRLESWKDAARYASLAVSASEHRVQQAIEQSNAEWDDRYEHLYLEAVAIRFRLAATSPAAGRVYGDPWAEWLASADDRLNSCVQHHGAYDHRSRLMRSHSERASLHVSYCEWFAFGGLDNPSIYPDAANHALKSLRIVVENLHRCDDLAKDAEERAAEADGGPTGGSHFVLDAVTKQFRFNVFATVLVAARLKTLWQARGSEVDEIMTDLPEPYEVPWEKKPTIAKAYLAAVKGPVSDLLDLDTSGLSLPLDQAVIDGLKNQFASPVRAA
ncbi:hypothetical protein P1X14_13640 [Sphingomonas sp. AOB5]|uniref:hypothetical protein n=1 Tax=Sphingomonas sp. AOB5 TaxID=3034017 RepID=UPI0023F93FD9|nr:hypothetical protein [Sphingomonas sp. AOB5]MDF7776293.1 hypothetical protein [Sphingomonas sp. AOB5]